MVSAFTPVRVFVRLTLAPPMTEPELSWTVPKMVVEVVCDHREARDAKKIMKKRLHILKRIPFHSDDRPDY